MPEKPKLFVIQRGVYVFEEVIRAQNVDNYLLYEGMPTCFNVYAIRNGKRFEDFREHSYLKGNFGRAVYPTHLKDRKSVV